MEWSEKLCFGVDIIDDQHKEIIKRVNDILDCLENQIIDETKIELFLDFLADYTMAHFTMEEKLQIKSDYPKYEEHLEEHNRFIGSFVKMRTTFMKKGSSADSLAIIKEIVVDWLYHHIAVVDSEFAEYYLVWKKTQQLTQP